MNKKGFTLVELLAVVVVLAVVSIIAIPITINIIENARKGALEESAKGLMDAASNYYALHGKDITDYVDFSIVDGKQTSSEKLNYKGSIDNGYLRLVDAKTMALCIDDNKYFAVKNLDSNEIIVDEGVCSGEYDEELLGYVTVGNAAYIGTRLSVKAYTSSSSLPSRAHDGDIGVVTNTKISNYYVSPTAPETTKDGMVWIVSSSNATNYVSTPNSKIGVSYILQYEDSDWKLKEAYVYNGEWKKLSDFNGNFEWTYDYTGHYEEFVAPYSGYYTFELWGAGYSTTSGGAYTKGDIYLNTDEKLYIYVGGNPWNGGATGYYASYGATDVRTIPTLTPTTWNEIYSLRSRIMVAAGSGSNGVSGAGGGLEGYTATIASYAAYCGRGASQISGGPLPSIYAGSGTTAGSFGVGGQGGTSSSSGGSGGGGGGWYGGSGASGANSGGWPGGGGSSYISGHEGCNSVDTDGYHTGSFISSTNKYFLNTKMIDGKGYEWTTVKGAKIDMPTHDGTTTVAGNQGNGYAKVTFKNFASVTQEQYDEIHADILNVWVYNYRGYYVPFTALKSGKYKIELWGAGYSSSSGGAYTKGTIELNKGQTIYVYVGGNPWNGGGSGYVAGYGATDVRTVPSSSTTTWSDFASLKSRIMVAAGGGGNGGAAGGGLTGYNATASSYDAYCGRGATQIAGGARPSIYAGSGTTAGSFGIGGQGGTSSSSGGSGAGGGGWFGGSGASGANSGGWGGGGGSSYISGHNGCIAIKEDGNMKTTTASSVEDSYSYTGFKFTDTEMIDGQGYKWTNTKGSLVRMPTHDGESLMNGNGGNGYAKITYVGK